jgi:hypothetical protein
MNGIEIKALGNFLSYYESDLDYITNFQRFLAGKISVEDFGRRPNGILYRFLVEYKIIRNIGSDQSIILASITKNWCESKSTANVDQFAIVIQKEGITRNAIPRSLASKVLFLSNPWEIFPMDALARKTLKEKTHQYQSFHLLLQNFRSENKERVQMLSQQVAPLVRDIENRYRKELAPIKIIRENRLIDKLLWISGASHSII